MATPPLAKRFRTLSPSFSQLQSGLSDTIVKEAQEIGFPWEDDMPDNIKEWFEAFGKSHNTAQSMCLLERLYPQLPSWGPIASQPRLSGRKAWYPLFCACAQESCEYRILQ